MSWSVADVMTKEVVVVGPDDGFKTCVRLLRRHRISALPVVDRSTRKVIGIVSEGDLLVKERERGAKRQFLGIRWEGDGAFEARTAGDFMSAPAVCIKPTASIPEAARLMYREAVKRVPVVDANGTLVGIVSRTDLLSAFMRSDESLRKEVSEDVLRKTLFIDPATVAVDVNDGVVRLSGELETKSLVNLVVRMVERVEGTVGVDSRLTYRLDDARLRVELAPGALELSAEERSSGV